ncbi:MAG: sugar phosphate isomerase/epimerase family protein, partial [Gemmatimonadaceae bacterium]
LYTVRSEMARDVDATLSALAEMGYTEVELAGNHGLSARQMRAALDRAGLTAVSSHVAVAALRDGWAPALDDAAALGQSFIGCPWVDPAAHTTVTDYRRLADLFNEAGAAARRAELRFFYHNHAFEFETLVDGAALPYDILLEECDPGLVEMELDLFWVTKAGADPIAYFDEHPGRFPLVHVKDMTRGGAMADVGAGAIDFAGIFARAARGGGGGIEHYFVEHDNPPSPLDSARASYQYLSRLDF